MQLSSRYLRNREYTGSRKRSILAIDRSIASLKIDNLACRKQIPAKHYVESRNEIKPKTMIFVTSGP